MGQDAAGTTAYWAVDEKPKRSLELKRLRNLRENDGVALAIDIGRVELWEAALP